MSPQTNIKASIGFKVGVKGYKLTYYGRPYWAGCTIKSKLEIFSKYYNRAAYKCIRDGLCFAEDEENVNSRANFTK